MIPRPIFKIMAVPLWLFACSGIFWAWFHWAQEPRPYYLWYQSGFLYERLLLPALPRLPFSKPETEHYLLLATPCQKGSPDPKRPPCMATPQSIAAGRPTFTVIQYADKATVLAELQRDVYHGTVLGALWLPICSVPFLLVLLFGGAVYLDYKRRRKILAGVQLLGRWPVDPADFGGWWAKWTKSSFRIDVEKPDERASPLG